MPHQHSVPTRAEVRERLLQLIHEIAEIPSETVTDQSTLDDQLSMESIAFVELQVALQDEYRIEIDPIRVVELNTFGAIVDYVHQCAAGAS